MNKDKEVILGMLPEKKSMKPAIKTESNTGAGFVLGCNQTIDKSAEMLAERVATTREIHNMICGDVPHSIDDCEHASEIVKALTKEYVILRRGK